MRLSIVATSLAVVVVVAAAAPALAQPGAPQPAQPPGPPAPGPYAPAPAPGPYAPAPGPYAPAPGPYAPAPGPYAPAPYGQPGMVPAPYAYRPSPEEQDILDTGYINPVQTLAGGALEFFFGFGIGQAIEGRWHDTGWIFTLGESASLVGVIAGAISLAADCPVDESCSNDSGAVTLVVAGALAYAGFHIWGTIDALVGPGSHNEQVHAIRRRYGLPDYARITPYISRPGLSPDGGQIAGLALHF